MRTNPVRDLLRAGETAIGIGLGVAANPAVVKILAKTGYDFLFIDLEHNFIDPENLRNLTQMARSEGIAPFVRTADTEYFHIAHMLDSGAFGIFVPRVENRAQAERAVAAARFPPLGVRGCGTTATLEFNTPPDWGESLAWLNEQTLVVLQIESQQAIDSLDDILNVQGIDAIFVGPLDLSINLGVPGKMTHPRMIAAVDRVVQICQMRNMPCGILASSADGLQEWWEKGMRLLVCGNDQGILRSGAQQLVQGVRRFAGEPRVAGD